MCCCWNIMALLMVTVTQFHIITQLLIIFLSERSWIMFYSIRNIKTSSFQTLMHEITSVMESLSDYNEETLFPPL